MSLPPGLALCSIAELDASGARGVELEHDGRLFDVVVVATAAGPRAYHNSCPHQGTPLEIFPHRFLTRDGQRLLCATHGAEFTLDEGICVRGPCKGRALTAMAVVVEDGVITSA